MSRNCLALLEKVPFSVFFNQRESYIFYFSSSKIKSVFYLHFSNKTRKLSFNIPCFGRSNFFCLFLSLIPYVLAFVDENLADVLIMHTVLNLHVLENLDSIHPYFLDFLDSLGCSKAS